MRRTRLVFGTIIQEAKIENGEKKKVKSVASVVPQQGREGEGRQWMLAVGDIGPRLTGAFNLEKRDGLPQGQGSS